MAQAELWKKAVDVPAVPVRNCRTGRDVTLSLRDWTKGVTPGSRQKVKARERHEPLHRIFRI
jgi:hypothetical protein